MDEAKQNANAGSNNRSCPKRQYSTKDSIMNTLNKIFSAAATAAVLLSANAAFADTGLTRAEVVADLAQARASGALAAMNSEDSSRFLQAPVSAAPRTQVASTQVAGPKTRAQVIAELRDSQADGSLALLHGEYPADQVRLAQILNKKAAAPVMAE